MRLHAACWRCLLYAVHIDINLDVEGIARTLSTSNELQNEAMSLAQKLRLEGRQEGRAEGVWSGKIQLLEQLMGLQPTEVSQLSELGVSALEARYNELEQQYNLRFKK